MSDTTTVQVLKSTRKALEEARLVPGETIDNVIQRALTALKEKKI
jgi:hypothetical protein